MALRDTDATRVEALLDAVTRLLQQRDMGRAGVLGRFLFPDRLSIAHNLQAQLQIRAARQSFIQAMQGKPSIAQATQLLEGYLDKLLAWNAETGWNRMIEITVWPQPIFEGGADMTAALYRLKQILADRAPYASYAKVSAFFDPIARRLLQKYDEDSVRVGAIDPLQLAVIQSQ
jgi:hypothetical protein